MAGFGKACCVGLLAWIVVSPPASSAEAGGGAPPAVADPASLCESRPPRRTGTITYYCDCRTGAAPGCLPGNDGNPGTTPSAPRRTLADAVRRFNEMNAGDTVALCRTGAWDESAEGIANRRCRATSEESYCDFRDYLPPWASSTSAKPRINAGARHAFPIWNGDAAYEGYRFWNLDIRHDSRAFDGPRSFFILSRQSHIDICNVTSRGGYIGVQAAGENATPYLTIRQSTFADHGWDAILAGSSHLTIDSNTFVNNGDQAVQPALQGQAHTVYTACSSPCTDMRITNNVFRTDPDGDWGQCRGVMLIVRGRQSGLVVENNLFVGSGPFGCGALSLSEGGTYAEFRDVAIRRNRVAWRANVDTQMMQIDGCRECVVSDNLIDSAGGGWGIQVPRNVSANLGPTTRVVIQNNSIRMNGGVAIEISKAGDGFVVENNAVWMAKGACFDVTRPTSRFGNNFCRTSGGAPVDAVWMDAASGNFNPRSPGPLIGGANQRHYSARALGGIEWSPADPGLARRPPIDIGALQRERSR